MLRTLRIKMFDIAIENLKKDSPAQKLLSQMEEDLWNKSFNLYCYLMMNLGGDNYEKAFRSGFLDD